jgi:peroxiredoxin
VVLTTGGAAHLPGAAIPPIALPSTRGDRLRVDMVPSAFERLVIFAYPLTGLPGVEDPLGWDEIPGARGCTAESCGFRDHAAELASVGAAVVGLSTQSTAYQREAAERLLLPYPLVSDAELLLTSALRLPTFTARLRPEHDGGGHRTLLERLTLVVREGAIERVFHPVRAPELHADEVLAWIWADRPGDAP